VTALPGTHSRGLGRADPEGLFEVLPVVVPRVKGVQPTNNHAERALRGAVIYRKLALGSQSPGGERRLERLLSAHTTCRLQRRSLHAYLVDLLGAHARGDPCPLLT
jgi:transposase